jgi:hypothetical protein
MGETFTPAAVQMMPTYRLDDLIQTLELPVPTRLKIDVDGYEEPVLRGATRLLTGGTVRDLVVEVVNHDGAETRLGTITGLLGSHGYELLGKFEHEPTGGREMSLVADYHFGFRGSTG